MDSIEITVIVDRVEGDFVILEWLDDFVEVPVATFPAEPVEGMAFTISIEPAEELTERMMADMFKLIDDMGDDDDGSDLDL